MVSRLIEEKRTANEESNYGSARRNSLMFQLEMKEIYSPYSKQPPCFTANLSMAFSCNQILDLFNETACKHNYNIVQREQAQATAVSRSQSTLKDFLNKCLPIRKSLDSQQTTIQIFVGYNEKKCLRTVLIKGLMGDIKQIRGFVRCFTKKLNKLQSQRKLTSSQQDPFRSSITEEEEETTYTLSETSSYYQFHKILSQESYSLGKSMSIFTENFNKQYKSIEESAQLLPQPLEAIKNHIEHTISTLFSDFNCGKLQAEKMMVFCRPAVEKFVFGKLNARMENIYRFKYREEDDKFAINSQVACKMDLMNFLEFKQKFRLEGVSSPYSLAIAELQKIKEQQNPKDKIQCIITTSAAVKTAVIDC